MIETKTPNGSLVMVYVLGAVCGEIKAFNFAIRSQTAGIA